MNHWMEQDTSIPRTNIWIYKQVYVQRHKEIDTVYVAMAHPHWLIVRSLTIITLKTCDHCLGS